MTTGLEQLRAVYREADGHLPPPLLRQLKRAIRSVRDEIRAAPTERTGRLDYSDLIEMWVTGKGKPRLGACAKEPWTVEWIEGMRPGEAFYDVGASVGPYTLVAHAAHGGKLPVVAIEPSALSFGVLCRNLELNDAQGNVIPLPVAVSSTTGVRNLDHRVFEPGAGMHRLEGERPAPAAGDFRSMFAQPVLTYRLDDLVSAFSLPPPAHIKLDVDGGELSALHGAENVLVDPRLRTVMVELDVRDAEPIGRFLHQAGLGDVEHFERRGKHGVPLPHWYALFSR